MDKFYHDSAMQYHKLDDGAVLKLLAYWSARLGIEGVGNNADPSCAVGFAAEQIIGADNVAALDGSVAFTEGIEVGIRAAAAVLTDPLGDPRERLRAAFISIKAELSRFRADV